MAYRFCSSLKMEPLRVVFFPCGICLQLVVEHRRSYVGTSSVHHADNAGRKDPLGVTY